MEINKLDLLNNLLEQSEISVNKLYKEMGNVMSQEEKNSEITIKNIIKEKKEKHLKLKEKFQLLTDKLSRKNCQILIYGKVSCGKSRIINAMLGENIFHSASSHTTSCFVKIRKSSDQSHHIECNNIKDPYNEWDDLKNKIKEMSTVFSNDKNKLETNELLTVYLNISDNKILTSSTEIIDCPGSANSESITNYIKDKGLNTDIFIFVSTNGMTEDEKQFFKYQWDNSSKPIIFVLVNKWDLAYIDEDDVPEESKVTITRGLMEFLINGIKLPENEARSRIFFVSALGMCEKRKIGKAKLLVNDDLKEQMCHEFENFEESLSQFIKIFIENKSKYEGELNKLKEEITNVYEQFKTEFRKEIYIANIGELKTLLLGMQTSSKDKETEIKTIKDKLENQIKSIAEECKKDFSRFDIKSLEKKIKSLINKSEKSTLKLKDELEKFIFDEIKKYKNHTKIEIEKNKHDLKKMMKIEIKLTKISSSFWEWLRNLFSKIFSKIFTSPRDEFLTDLNEKDSDTLNEIKEGLDSAIDKFQTDSIENLDSLSEYLKTEIKIIINQLELKIQVYEEFSTNIDNLFQ